MIPSSQRSRRLATALIAIALLSLQAPVARAGTPRESIQETMDRVLVVLRDPGLDSKAKVARIEPIAADHFDFDTVSRLVLAQNWKQLSDEQKREFARLFQKHLSVTYGKSVDSYVDQKVVITGDHEEARGDWTVQTKIVGDAPDDEVMVDYRLRKEEKGWKIIDVVVERISLVSNFRSQLRELISNGGVDHTLEVLREKNAAGQSILPEEKLRPQPK